MNSTKVPSLHISQFGSRRHQNCLGSGCCHWFQSWCWLMLLYTSLLESGRNWVWAVPAKNRHISSQILFMGIDFRPCGRCELFWPTEDDCINCRRLRRDIVGWKFTGPRTDDNDVDVLHNDKMIATSLPGFSFDRNSSAWCSETLQLGKRNRLVLENGWVDAQEQRALSATLINGFSSHEGPVVVTSASYSLLSMRILNNDPNFDEDFNWPLL